MRDHPTARRDPFVRGLQAHGFHVLPPQDLRFQPRPGDLLVTWNRMGVGHQLALKFEILGLPVIVAENGYTTQATDCWLYALALNHHNGAGHWFVGDEDRTANIDLPLVDWRTRGDHILVLPQRGYGPPSVAQPRGWRKDVVHNLRRKTDRPVRVREHPGNLPKAQSPRPLSADLESCHAAVVWGSGAGIKAVIMGIPVFHFFPQWIGGSAARFGLDAIENPWMLDRMPMLKRLAWAQWNVNEIEAGEPFAHLLRLHSQKKGQGRDARAGVVHTVAGGH